MNRFHIVWILFLITHLFTVEAAIAENIVKHTGDGAIYVRLIGFDNNHGKAIIALVNNKDGFAIENSPIPPAKSAAATINSNGAEYLFEEVPYGEYSVQVFHDENSNGEMDSNFLGMPKEAYGFSNNVRGTLSPPSFDDASFILDKKRITITIKVE
ncbi:MAG: DUF2141 domain-containing protein [Deltaproteobacteria bacterium]|nr:DUF2141 domain-containing protein [Deltaproteobacteria bacterium]